MPVVRKCLYCNKTLLTSTYGLMKHMGKCSKLPIETRKVFSGESYRFMKNKNVKNMNHINSIYNKIEKS